MALLSGSIGPAFLAAEASEEQTTAAMNEMRQCTNISSGRKRRRGDRRKTQIFNCI